MAQPIAEHRRGEGGQSPAHAHLPCLGAKQVSDQWNPTVFTSNLLPS